MSQERRAAPRARVPGSFVHCETAEGERIQATVLNVSTAGLFIPTTTPFVAGKRFSLRIRVGGGPVPWWAGLARVIWVRDSATGDGPAGMGAKILDFDDDAASAAIARVIEEHLTAPPVNAAQRERTVLGVGSPSAVESERPTLIEAPVAPTRERTVLGVGAAQPPPPAREPSSVEPDTAAPPAPASHSTPPDSDSSLVAAGVPRRRGGGWFVFLLIVIAGGAGGYALRDRWLPRARAMLTELTSSPPASPPPMPSPPSPAISATTTASTSPTASASSTPSAMPRTSATAAAPSPSGTSAAPGASAPARQPPLRPAVSPPPAPAATKSNNDNPY
jgi:hypothetical protein